MTKAVQNKLCGLSQKFLQRVRGREVEKHTHQKKNTQDFFLKTMRKISLAWSQSQLDFVTLHLKIEGRINQSFKQPVVFKFELMLSLLMKK